MLLPRLRVLLEFKLWHKAHVLNEIISIDNAYYVDQIQTVPTERRKPKGIAMSFAEMLLWPGTKFCERVGIDPMNDAGLIRWLIITLVYLIVSLVVVWIVAI